MASIQSIASGLPTVEPGRAPDAYDRTQASAEAFGGGVGRALQQAGAQVQQTSGVMLQTAAIYDEAAADDAANQFQSRVTALLYGDPEAVGPDGQPTPGYLSLKGRAALDARKGVDDKIKGLQKEISGNLKTPVQQKRFADIAGKYTASVGAKIGAYATEQSNAWYSEVNKATETLALQQVANSINDPQALAAAASDLRSARVREAQLKGGGPELVAAAVATADRDFIKAQTEALAVDNPAEAMRVLDANKKAAGTYYDELATKFRTRAAEQVGRTAAAAAMAAANTAPATTAPAAQAAPEQQAKPLSAPAEAVHGAIIQQESGGNPNAPTSVNGAVGMGQILPDTFKRYAMPGERIDNPSDNLAVSQRIVADYAAKYKGDPARIAVAYFSGEGNVSPPGSPTPWKEDRKDGNGKSVSSYVADVTGRLQGAGATVPLETKIAQSRADAVRRIVEDKALKPEERTAALKMVKETYDAQLLAAEQDAKAKTAANDQAADGYIQLINSNQITPATLQQINRDPNLKWETRRSLYDAAMKKTGSDVDQSAQAYGPGFWKAFRQVTAPAGDPERITEIGELLRRAGPGGDLTLDGVTKLNDALKEMAKPENAAVAEMKKGAMAYAKAQLSFEFEMGNFKMADPQGMADFNIKFIPAFYQAYDAGIKAGKTPYQLLSKESNDFIVDKLVSAYRRPEAQLMRDRLAAGGSITGGAEKYPTPESLRDAVRSGKLSREEGAKIVVQKGWARVAAPGPSVPMSE